MTHNIFITVGTTEFNGLIQALDEIDWSKAFPKQQIQLVVQYGKGTAVMQPSAQNISRFDSFRYKGSILPDIKSVL